MSLSSQSEEDVIKRSGDQVLCKRTLEDTKKLLKEFGVTMTEPQWLSLVSHISAMVYRSVNKECIQPLEVHLFSEVSKESIELASRICSMLENLHEHEKYLLSIHFEGSKKKGGIQE